MCFTSKSALRDVQTNPTPILRTFWKRNLFGGLAEKVPMLYVPLPASPSVLPCLHQGRMFLGGIIRQDYLRVCILSAVLRHNPRQLRRIHRYAGYCFFRLLVQVAGPFIDKLFLTPNTQSEQVTENTA